MLNTEAKKEKVNKNKGYIAKKNDFFLEVSTKTPIFAAIIIMFATQKCR